MRGFFEIFGDRTDHIETEPLLVRLSIIVQYLMSSTKGYAPVNGLKMYYEIHGSGQPLVLLHGGAGATEMFGEVLQPLSEGRRVVAADLQAHGRTADIDRPLRYELMADDIAALIGHLRLGKA